MSILTYNLDLRLNLGTALMDTFDEIARQATHTNIPSISISVQMHI